MGDSPKLRGQLSHSGYKPPFTDGEFKRALRRHSTFTEAANSLGVSRQVLSYHYKKLGIKRGPIINNLQII